VSEIDFTDDQMAAIRRGLGVPDGAPDPPAEDIIICLEARQIVNDGERAWLDGDGP
jgi:hypothetical protein